MNGFFIGRGCGSGLAEARRNRTNPSTLPRRNNGFEDRGSHQTPFASSERRARTITLRFREKLSSAPPHPPDHLIDREESRSEGEDEQRDEQVEKRRGVRE